MMDRRDSAPGKFASLLARIQLPDDSIRAATQDVLDRKTKPRRSLGKLEDLACRISAIRGTTQPGMLSPTMVLAAGDHGIAEEGVSAYPQEVTGQMLLNFASGGAAICVLAREAGARLVVVDAGTVAPIEHPAIRDCRVGPGTRNSTKGPAMSREEAVRAVEHGVTIAAELAGEGAGIIGLGDMGIASTASASALCAALLPAEPADVCGHGTGVNEEGLARKVDAVGRAVRANAVDGGDGLEALAGVGGFEIGLLAGVALGCAANRVPVLVDGFITGAAALVAARIAPVAADYMIASHLSQEPGHRLVLDDLVLDPLLQLDMRLGEGTGAALAMPLVRASLAILADMATFDDAGVTDTGA